jgi:hypothetical protein
VATDQPPATAGTLTSRTGTSASASGTVSLLAVGDIADCTTTADDRVAAFLLRRSAPIVTLGDTVYESGSPQEFAACFDPWWGRMLQRIRPAVGNHEYRTPAAKGYFGYFGERAGRPGRGWYARNIGDHWKLIVLNSQCARLGCETGSRQHRWLRGALERAGRRNVIAVLHHPRFSTGKHGPNRVVLPLYRALYRARADILLSGHDHSYERFAPRNAKGQRRRHGVQQFVVGTGGRGLYPFRGPPHRLTRARDNTTYGVLRLILRPNGYRWRFLPVIGDFTDSGRRSL